MPPEPERSLLCACAASMCVTARVRAVVSMTRYLGGGRRLRHRLRLLLRLGLGLGLGRGLCRLLGADRIGLAELSCLGGRGLRCLRRRGRSCNGAIRTRAVPCQDRAAAKAGGMRCVAEAREVVVRIVALASWHWPHCTMQTVQSAGQAGLAGGMAGLCTARHTPGFHCMPAAGRLASCLTCALRSSTSEAICVRPNQRILAAAQSARPAP